MTVGPEGGTRRRCLWIMQTAPQVDGNTKMKDKDERVEARAVFRAPAPGADRRRIWNALYLRYGQTFFSPEKVV